MKTASTRLELDRRYLGKKDLRYHVAFVISWKSKKHRVNTYCRLNETEWESFKKGNYYNEDLRIIKKDTDRQLKEIKEVLRYLGSHFTFERFLSQWKIEKERRFRQEEEIFRRQESKENIYMLFEEYAERLESHDRISYSESMISIMKSFQSFAPKLKIEGVTPDFLYGYENHLLKKKRSYATIASHTRNMRTIFNYAVHKKLIDKDSSPFGRRLIGKYTIPFYNGRKKALDIDVVKLIRDAKPTRFDVEYARDIWMFIFYCNGINIGDLINLKWGDVEGRYIRFTRNKTVRHQLQPIRVTIYLTDPALRILKRWSNKRQNKKTLIFGQISDNLTAKEKYHHKNNFTAYINHKLGKLCNELGVERITTYTARHTYATYQKYLGTPIEKIAESLGHSDIKTTLIYLKAFPDNAIKESAEDLLAFLDEGKV